jgi:diguanylate cyclase (GGDEF)-like protein
VLAILVAVGIVIGFVLWATADLDRRSLERETELLTRIMSDEVAQIPHDQQSVAIWDDAVENTAVHFDPGWIDINLGSWMASYFGHDEVFILDARDRPVYAMGQGHAADPGLFSGDLEDIAPLVRQMRQLLAGGALDGYRRGVGPFPAVADLALVGSRPAIVGVAPLSYDTPGRVQPPGTEFLHVSVVLLADSYAAQIADRYQLRDAHFTLVKSDREGQAYYPLMNRAGRFVAFFEWQPDRPGQLVLSRTAPGLATGFVIAGIVIFLLLTQLWRSAAVLRADRLTAQHRARHDPLTGLPNRTEFEAQLAAALRPDEPRAEPLALLMLDLDRFKQVNDTLGHQAGDELIQAVSQRLRGLVRPADTIARIGGDEFAVIHLTQGGEPEALRLSEKIIEALGKPFDVFGREAFVGVSIGVAVAEHTDHDRLEVIRRGDIALHEAKASGRNRAVVFTEAMSELLQGRHAIESELREALRWGDQLSVAYQPLFSRETDAVIGAEALARWTHPRLGLVAPALFIPVAEATGLIEALGDFVLRESCLLGAHWPGRTIAVNISPTQLRNPAFPGRVFELLKTTGMRTADLELEITEGILLEESPEITDALSSFRAAGIRIALDDFGTGYSSLNYLKRYPVERIKIDRSFVSQLMPGNSSVAIVQAMVTLAHALGISVTAEGVETEEQKAILSQMGCNTFQGFLMSAPVSRPAIERMFRDTSAAASSARPKAVA